MPSQFQRLHRDVASLRLQSMGMNHMLQVKVLLNQQLAEAVLVLHRRDKAKHQHQRIKRQQRDRADKAELLAQRGEDKVGVLFGQKVQPALRALHEPLARPAA